TQEPAQDILSEKTGITRAGLRDESDAIRQLAQRWNLPLAEGDACDAIRAHNVLCHRSNGGIAELRQLDRPALLKLYDQANRPFYALIGSLSDTTARLRAGDARQDVSLVALANHFRGEFITLWRAPRDFDNAVQVGDRGPAVDWFAAHLAKLSSADAPAPGQPLSQKTLKQVRQFQQAHGLFVDGVIGPLTAMHINRAAGIDEPRLAERTQAE
ncbi:peptidoglycan-binding domain-containing protein, partial [Noviherbaspirillum denitrificans]|uniref:peptidoglycan-binding domain-containing protein n=1 Tax=Noviherbaspirillum denitrificans TaxID=1968433 RepID=UPI0019815AA8